MLNRENVYVRQDPAGNIKMDKEKSTEKTEESEVHSEKEKLQEYKSLLLKYKEENEGGEQTDSTDDTESPKVKVLKMYK